MILNEDFGNLQALSPQAQKIFTKSYPNDRLKNSLGKNSVVKIVKQDKIKDILKNNNPFTLPLFILRYKGMDKVYFYTSNSNYWIYASSKYDRERWGNTPFSSDNGKKDGFKNFLEEIYNNYYKDEVPTFEEFLKGISYQLVFADEDRIKKQDERSKSLGDILKKSKDKTYKTDYDFNNSNNYSKIHGSVYDTRNTYGYYKKSLKERLKKYIESKFPKFDSIEDFANANIKDILKSFKIKDNIYTYNQDATERVINGNTDPLFNLYKNKKAFIGYKYQGQDYWSKGKDKEIPLFIYFEIIMDVNHNIRVSNIYGAMQDSQNDLEPLSKWFEKKDNKDNKDNKLSHNYNVDDEDDW